MADLPHDARLYVSQMLLAMASSPLPWTGEKAIRVVGYSLGGGIAIHFANAFPHLVKELALLAPAGLIHAASFGRVSQFLFKSGYIPERLLAIATRQRLQKPIASSRAPKAAAVAVDPMAPATEVAAAEVGVTAATDTTTTTTATTAAVTGALAPLEHRVMDYVRWMVVHHHGFVPAFMSSIRHAPLTDQHESWARLALREPGTTAILLAEADEIIDCAEYRRDGLPLVGGEDNVAWRVLPGSHDFVMTHTDNIVSELINIWGTKP